jgi:CRISPR-associated exonuclease Cas4
MKLNDIPENYEHELVYTGTQVNYYLVCKRKLWLFSHNINLESESDLVQLGRLLHGYSYKRRLREVQIGRIKIDFLDRKESIVTDQNIIQRDILEISFEKEPQKSFVTLHEIKKSKSMHNAHVFQLLYYIYYLRKNYNINVNSGILHYPLLRINVPVELSDGKVNEVENLLSEMKRVLSLPYPPAATRILPCKSCAYREMCWG